jgi:flagellar motor switch protein FliG
VNVSADTISSDAAQLTALQKAAVLVMNLPEDVVRQLLGQLDEEQVRAVGTAVASLPELSRETVEEVCLEFVGRIVSPAPLRLEGRRYLQNVFPRVADPSVAQEIVRKIDGRELRGMRAWLSAMPAATLASVIGREHPQTIAVICALADPRVTARIIQQLPEEARDEVLMRQAQLSELSAEVLGELEEVLIRTVPTQAEGANTDLEGVESAAAVLKSLAPAEREELLKRIRAADEELGEAIMRSMYSFDTLYYANDQGIQGLLKMVDRKDLTVALKGSPPNVQEKFYRNMSQRAAMFLKEDLEVLGAMRLEDVDEAQRRIMAQALVLEGQGKLMFVNADDGDMIL